MFLVRYWSPYIEVSFEIRRRITCVYQCSFRLISENEICTVLSRYSNRQLAGRARNNGSIPDGKKIIFCSPQCSDRLRGPPSFLNDD
jgi:hypothetical protein